MAGYGAPNIGGQSHYIGESHGSSSSRRSLLDGKIVAADHMRYSDSLKKTTAYVFQKALEMKHFMP